MQAINQWRPATTYKNGAQPKGHPLVKFIFLIQERIKMEINNQRPSSAFIAASWVALLAGIVAFNVGLWNASMLLNEKGYYFTVLMFGLFSAVSLQKSVRDRLEGLPVTNIYYGLSWFSTILAILLLVVGLWNATMTASEKGFYAMSFTLSLFAAIAVQKNTRDDKPLSSSNEHLLARQQQTDSV